jgi:hypothetical protein
MYKKIQETASWLKQRMATSPKVLRAKKLDQAGLNSNNFYYLYYLSPRAKNRYFLSLVCPPFVPQYYA